MECKGRSRGVYAGLMTALGVSAALVATPAAVYAEDVTVPDGPAAIIESSTPADIQAAGSDLDVSLNVNEGESALGGEGDPLDETLENEGIVSDGENTPSDTEGEESIVNEGEGSEDGSENGALPSEDATASGNESDSSATDETTALVPELVLSEQTSATATLPSNAASTNAEDDGTEEDGAEEDTLVAGEWIVKDAGDGSGLQRYFQLSDGTYKKDGIFKAVLAGVKSWFCALSDGRIVRGRVTIERSGVSYTYLADNDGRLLNPGWHVTDDFGQGLQRYYVDADEHACVEGYSEDGWAHYTRKEGYVVRGKYDTGAASVILANNDGKTATGSGWLVTGDYDNGSLQRYYLNGKGGAKSSYFDVGSEKYFGLGGLGYVLRGAGWGVDGYRLYADNDGKLARSEWVVTTALGNGLQRYWFDSAAHLATGRFINTSEGSGWKAYALSDGIILRGGRVINGKKYFADNDGRISMNQWVVTGDFTGGALERYWATSDGSFKTSDGKFNTNDFFDDGGWWAYALSDGRIFRGKKDNSKGSVFLADNDGRLAVGLSGWVVTDDYDNGALQRYWMNGDGSAKSGFFTASLSGVTQKFFGLGGQGYVLRGTTGWDKFVLLANNDGIMPTKEGWLITDAYGQGLQRYMIAGITGQTGFFGALTGYFSVKSDGTADTSGKDYYGRAEGYVVRGYYVIPGTDELLYGDNDGVLKPITEFPFVANILKRIFWTSSQTQYLIGVDVVGCWTVVFQGSAGNWKPIKVWRCVTGRPDKHNGLGTPRGDYMIGYDGANYNWPSPGGYRTEYWAKTDVCYFTGFCLNLGFHSTKRVNGGYSDDGGQLGNRLSDGCVRLAIENAKWIYENCLPGTHVTTI